METRKSVTAKMADIINKLYLPPQCRRVLCAVSGGADSVCLLHLLNENRERLGIELRAAHFEHGIRGGESLRDADFVKRLCERLDVELYTESGDTPAYAREMGMSMEEAARELRYAFLERAAGKLACDYIATAHNADDNAETVIFNLVRGSGARGLGGIPVQRGHIIRPLLSVTRQEIEAYLNENSIEHISDSTNLSDDYSRNLIRHQVLPVLKTINPGLVGSLCRTAALMRQDEDCLDAMARSFIEENARGDAVDCKALLSLHEALSSRVLRLMCPRSLSAAHVKALMELAAGEGLGFCDVSGLRVRREQGRLCFAPEEGGVLPERRLLPGETVSLPEAGIQLKIEETVYDGEIHDLFKTYPVKCESISGHLICSSRKPGDKISPQGRNCTKSLKSIFVEKKMTQRQRDLCPVIRDDKGVLILLGHAVDERCRPEKGERILRIEVKNLE